MHIWIEIVSESLSNQSEKIRLNRMHERREQYLLNSSAKGAAGIGG